MINHCALDPKICIMAMGISLKTTHSNPIHNLAQSLYQYSADTTIIRMSVVKFNTDKTTTFTLDCKPTERKFLRKSFVTLTAEN